MRNTIRCKMQSAAKRFGVVFGLWTLIAICGGAADYVFLYAVGSTPPSLWTVFRRPLTEQWIWAALTPAVFVIARRFPLGRPPVARSFLAHAIGFLALSLLHCAVAGALGGPLASAPPHYHGSVLELRFLEEFYSDIWMYWPLVCIQALIDSHARTREREQRAAELESLLTTSRLALLRAQIQPHFLFNTLHALSALIRIDVAAAEDMVADLADILRASFSDPTSQETSLRREMELVGCYMRIQSRRFGDRLDVRYQIAPDTLDALVPALVLQSLVENAVIHGAGPITRPVTIEIRAYRREDSLLLHVDDDGAGLPLSPHSGLGLSNARRRLQQLYGAEHLIELTGRPGRGTSVTLMVPFRVFRGATGESVIHEDKDADRGRRSAGAAPPLLSVGR